MKMYWNFMESNNIEHHYSPYFITIYCIVTATQPQEPTTKAYKGEWPEIIF